MTETEDLVYADLEDFDLGTRIKTLETENTKLRKEIEDSNLQINCLKKQVSELSAENGSLKNNISSLMLTAKIEINRKDKVIADLRREKDQILFRRGKNIREIKPNNFNNKTIAHLGDADIRCETPKERLSVQAISCTQKRKIGLEEYRNGKRSRTDISPDAKSFIPDAKPSIPDVKPSIPDVHPSIPDAKPSIPDAKPTIPDAKPCIPDQKSSTLVQVRSNIIINNVNEITIPIKRRKKQIHKLPVHSTSNDINDTTDQENIKANDLSNNKILESNSNTYKKEEEYLDTLKKNNKNICNKETISNSQTHKNSELNRNQEKISEKNIDDKKYEKDNDLKMMRKTNHRTCEKESDFKLDRRRDSGNHEHQYRLKSKDRSCQKICDTNMTRRLSSKNHEIERNSRSDRTRRERRSYEDSKRSRPEVKHNDRTRVKYNGRLRDKNEENRREDYRDCKSVGDRDFKHKAKMDYKSRNDQNNDRRKENYRDRYSRERNGGYFKEDRRRSALNRHSRSESPDRRSHSNSNERVEDDLIDNIKLRDKLRNQLRNIEDQEKLNSTNRHKPIDKIITDRQDNVKLPTKCVCASEDYESNNLDDSIINMYDDLEDIIPVYKNDTNIDIESSERDNSFMKSHISEGELTPFEDGNNYFQKDQKNINNEDDTHKNAVNFTSMTNNKTEINYPNYEIAFNRYAKNANFDNTEITESRKTQINKTNAGRQTSTVETINTSNLSKEEAQPLQTKISTGDTKLRTIAESKSENMCKSNVVSTNGDEEIKKDLNLSRSRNNQAIVKTNKDICNIKLTKDINDLFGESPAKGIGDTNKILKICKENVINRDAEMVSSHNENTNDDFEENFKRKLSDDSLILERAIASITGDSYDNNIHNTEIIKQKELVFRNIRDISPLEQEIACNNVVEITKMERETIYNIPEITTACNQETASETMDNTTAPEQEMVDDNNVLETPTSKQETVSNDVGERTTPNSLSALNSLISTTTSTYSRTVVDKNETTFSIKRKRRKIP